MSDEQPRKFESFAEQEMFIRSISAQSRIEDRKFLEFVSELEPLVNEGLKSIFEDCEVLFEPKYKELISQLWAEQSNRHIQEVFDNLCDAWFEYVFGSDIKQNAHEVRERIVDLFTTQCVEYNEAQLEHIVSDMFVFSEYRLSIKLFAPHLRQEGIPEAAIKLLYPLQASQSIVEYVNDKLDTNGFYPEPTRKTVGADQQSKVVSLFDFKPKD